MKTVIKLFLLILFAFGIECHCFMATKKADSPTGQILESDTLEDVRKYVEPATLFVFDLDNVLIEGKLDYGFGDWFYAVWTALQKGGLNKEEALGKFYPTYVQIQSTAEVQLIEDGAKKLISDLKNAGHNVMILTTRGLAVIDITFKQLKSTGIDIETNAIPENGLNSALGGKSKYLNGILFGCGCAKGPALKLFLQSNPDLGIKQVVFVNDKMRYIEEVRDSITDLDIKFVGIRYGRADARSKAYVLDDGSKLLVQKILSDSCLTAAV